MIRVTEPSDENHPARMSDIRGAVSQNATHSNESAREVWASVTRRHCAISLSDLLPLRIAALLWPRCGLPDGSNVRG